MMKKVLLNGKEIGKAVNWAEVGSKICDWAESLYLGQTDPRKNGTARRVECLGFLHGDLHGDPLDFIGNAREDEEAYHIETPPFRPLGKDLRIILAPRQAAWVEWALNAMNLMDEEERKDIYGFIPEKMPFMDGLTLCIGAGVQWGVLQDLLDRLIHHVPGVMETMSNRKKVREEKIQSAEKAAERISEAING
jgi:hypothetical protein